MNTSKPWPKSLVRLSDSLGSHPRWVGALSGGLLALAVFATAIATLMQLKIHEIDAGHARVHGRLQNSVVDFGLLLDELNSRYQPVCDEANLARLRSLLFSHRYAKQIGMLDEQGRQFCNTSGGRLQTPALPGDKAIEGAVGRYYVEFPVSAYNPLVDQALRSTVIERGRFQILVDRSSVEEAYAQFSDAVWAGSGPRRRRVFSGSRVESSNARIEPETPHLQFDWLDARMLVTNTMLGVSPVSAQSVVLISDLYAKSYTVMGGLVGLCLLLGWLTSQVVTVRCRALQSMDFRIHYLCMPGNVVCHYQPIIELNSGRVIGCEVLARLRDGKKLLYPDQFIDALSRQKLSWVFDAAVSQCALQELGQGLPVQPEGFKVALNFFPGCLKHEVLHAHLQTQLRVHARQDWRLTLEITEYDFTLEMEPDIRQLRAEGYDIVIDDFGTGYSNLGVVKRIAPDCIKIDKSFVFEMEDATMRSTLVPEIIAIARAIRAEVVAEGIENPAQLIRLRALGVQYGQGYYFLKPVPLAEFLAFVQMEIPAAFQA